MLNERRHQILRAVVEEYIASAQPVGSRPVVERYHLNCSPATVRSELSALEEFGHLAQPHTSAGRIPTDLGYRSVVDGYLSALEGRSGSPAVIASGSASAVDPSIGRATELSELLGAAANTLARHTHSLGIAIGPSIVAATVVRVDLLSLAPRRALFVLITDTGQVLNRHVDVPAETTPEELAAIERSLNASLSQKKAGDIARVRAALSEQVHAAGDGAQRTMLAVIDEVLDALREADSHRLKHRGVGSLMAQPEFTGSERLAPLVDLLDDGLRVLEVLADDAPSLGSSDGRGAISVRIGSENPHDGLGEVSIVVSPFFHGDSRGVVGVIGPTRMDYRRAIGAVRTTAERIEETLNER